MPSARWLILPILLLAGCNDRALRQRAEEIRQLSDKEDRAYCAQALSHIERRYWTVRGHAWLGKLPDGTLIRLEDPRAAAAPLPGVAFYSGWHLQLTISAQDWRSDPPSRYGQRPFSTVYAITRHTITSWDIRVTSGFVTAPVRPGEAARLEGDE